MVKFVFTPLKSHTMLFNYIVVFNKLLERTSWITLDENIQMPKYLRYSYSYHFFTSGIEIKRVDFNNSRISHIPNFTLRYSICAKFTFKDQE